MFCSEAPRDLSIFFQRFLGSFAFRKSAINAAASNTRCVSIIYINIGLKSLHLGDHLKKMVLFMAALCFAVLYPAGVSAADDAQASQNQILNSYEGNLTQKSLTAMDMLSLLGGQTGYLMAEAVKFTAPKPNWKIDSVQLFGWDGFNGTAESIPQERIIALEVRDKDLNLLYRLSDSQLPYTNYAYNATDLYPTTLRLPQVPVSDEFYICFYDRGAVAVACERLNETSKSSFLYLEPGNQLLPATLPSGQNNETIAVNWIMSVSGN
jgi:hypothetical protein